MKAQVSLAGNSPMRFVEALRERTGFSRTKLALELKIPSNYIYRYERPGADQIRLDVLCRLRKLAGISWSELGRMLDAEFIDEEKQK